MYCLKPDLLIRFFLCSGFAILSLNGYKIRRITLNVSSESRSKLHDRYDPDQAEESVKPGLYLSAACLQYGRQTIRVVYKMNKCL